MGLSWMSCLLKFSAQGAKTRWVVVPLSPALQHLAGITKGNNSGTVTPLDN